LPCQASVPSACLDTSILFEAPKCQCSQYRGIGRLTALLSCWGFTDCMSLAARSASRSYNDRETNYNAWTTPSPTLSPRFASFFGAGLGGGGNRRGATSSNAAGRQRRERRQIVRHQPKSEHTHTRRHRGIRDRDLEL
jgi:hypothetical protein